MRELARGGGVAGEREGGVAGFGMHAAAETGFGLCEGKARGGTRERLGRVLLAAGFIEWREAHDVMLVEKLVQLLPQNSPMRIVNGDADPSGTGNTWAV